MFFTKEKLFLAFLMNRCTKGAVRLVFDRLEKRMGTYEFVSVFEYILTDRGSEFGDPDALEAGVNGIQRSNIYYCDPMQSGQKGGLEQAHTMLRMVLPKGTCFEFLTQWDVNLIVNHINSTPRESLGGRTPYSVALETLGEEVLNAFQLRPIAPDEVNLTPKLIRFNHYSTNRNLLSACKETFHIFSMWPVEFSPAHCFSAVRFPCPEIKYFSMSLANYSRKQEILLKNFLQNQQKIKCGGIYLCTGI